MIQRIAGNWIALLTALQSNGSEVLNVRSPLGQDIYEKDIAGYHPKRAIIRIPRQNS